MYVKYGWMSRNEGELNEAIADVLRDSTEGGTIEAMSQQICNLADAMGELMSRLVDKNVLTLDEVNEFISPVHDPFSRVVVTVFINGKKHHLDPAAMISYEDLCKIARVAVSSEATVTWSAKSKSGTITPGQSAPLAEGAIYNITHTGGA